MVAVHSPIRTVLTVWTKVLCPLCPQMSLFVRVCIHMLWPLDKFELEYQVKSRCSINIFHSLRNLKMCMNSAVVLALVFLGITSYQTWLY